MSLIASWIWNGAPRMMTISIPGTGEGLGPKFTSAPDFFVISSRGHMLSVNEKRTLSIYDCFSIHISLYKNYNRKLLVILFIWPNCKWFIWYFIFSLLEKWVIQSPSSFFSLPQFLYYTHYYYIVVIVPQRITMWIPNSLVFLSSAACSSVTACR